MSTSLELIAPDTNWPTNYDIRP